MAAKTVSFHIPTLLLMVVFSSIVTAASVAVVSGGQARDGLRRWSAALLASAIGHTLLLLRGQVPDVLSVVLANFLLSGALVTLLSAIYRFQGRKVSLWRLLASPVLVVVFVTVFSENFLMRVIFVNSILTLQALWMLMVTLDRRHPTVGRGPWLVVVGLAVASSLWGTRAMVAAFFGDDATSILQGSTWQVLTFMSTFFLILVSSIGFVFMSRDRADELNRRMATLDSLTGVANRRSLIAALERDVARAVRTDKPIAVMMLDIDHFKNINDRYGHPAGDKVICCVVNVLLQSLRAGDFVGRYGGEEFMLVLPDTALDGAQALAGKLCKAVAASRCEFEKVQGTGVTVTVSIGVYGGSLDAGDSCEMLIEAADRALYRAKTNGRNRVEVAHSLRPLVA